MQKPEFAKMHINKMFFYSFTIVIHFIKSVLINEINSILNVLKFIPSFLIDTFWYWHEQNRLAPNNINDK